jgi:hypothetical protein
MSNFFKSMVTNTGIIGEIIQLLWARKLWWLIPMVTVLLLVGLLLVFAFIRRGAIHLYPVLKRL